MSQTTEFLSLRTACINATPDFVATLAKNLATTLARASPTNYDEYDHLVVYASLCQVESEVMQRIGAQVQEVFGTLRSIRPTRLSIGLRMISGANYEDVSADLANYEADDSSWVGNARQSYGVRQYSCGHWHRSGANVLSVNTNGSTATRSICMECVNDDTRFVHGWQGYMIHREEAIEVLFGEDDRQFAPRGWNELVEDAEFGWRHRNYDPYRYLIAGYHSSKGLGFKKFDSPWTKANKGLFFGVELEVESQNGNPTLLAKMIHQHVNTDKTRFLRFERDGSLSSYGFEMVSQPAGLDTHAAKWALWMNDPKITKHLRSHDTTTCGLHIHVGRDALSESQIARMQSFMNDQHNRAFVTRIARRWGGNYSRAKGELVGIKSYPTTTGDRYEALNLTNDSTIEFRVFRGTIKHQTLMAALEFVNALIWFSKPGVTSFSNYNSTGFREFISKASMAADTKNLRAHLKMQRYATTPYSEAA